jgi:hypothetical protein
MIQREWQRYKSMVLPANETCPHHHSTTKNFLKHNGHLHFILKSVSSQNLSVSQLSTAGIQLEHAALFSTTFFGSENLHPRLSDHLPSN